MGVVGGRRLTKLASARPAALHLHFSVVLAIELDWIDPKKIQQKRT